MLHLGEKIALWGSKGAVLQQNLCFFIFLMGWMLGTSAVAAPRCEVKSSFVASLSFAAAGVCKSRGYPGANADSAIAACVKAYGENNLGYCQGDVSCPSHIGLCKSRGYPGASADSAIEACVKAYGENNRGYCQGDVSCTN